MELWNHLTTICIVDDTETPGAGRTLTESVDSLTDVDTDNLHNRTFEDARAVTLWLLSKNQTKNVLRPRSEVRSDR